MALGKIGFNPRAREGRDILSPAIIWSIRSFNPRAREGRDDVTTVDWSKYAGFNPRAREGRDMILKFLTARARVSIHAPARGATLETAPVRLAASSFNPRAREGRDSGSGNRACGTFCFNPRAREGRDAWSQAANITVVMFQSTRPRGARLKNKIGEFTRQGFNPRAREGRDHAIPAHLSRLLQFQSTRPRGARRKYFHPWPCWQIVSIHAPARGATRFGRTDTATPLVSIHAPARGATRCHWLPRFRRRVSIHAPARGATGTRPKLFLPTHSFNPRAREGRDIFEMFQRRLSCVSIHAPARGATARVPPHSRQSTVSIHAPARGATGGNRPGNMGHTSFNPRAREGRDSRCGGRVAFPTKFQSTRPRGARPSRSHPPNTDRQFQSTRPRGARRRDAESIRPMFEFQSTRPRGARPFVSVVYAWFMDVSIHAPARGATVLAQGGDVLTVKFQSTRPRGARHVHKQAAPALLQFQSTRPRGARRPGSPGWCSSKPRFNPRAREGRDRCKPATVYDYLVSIHAPARGATLVTAGLAWWRPVSIHAPARGATCRRCSPRPCKKFQSTRPRGARPPGRQA